MKTCIHCGKKIEDKMMVCIFCKGSQEIKADVVPVEETSIPVAEEKPTLTETYELKPALIDEIEETLSEETITPVESVSIKDSEPVIEEQTEETLEPAVSEPIVVSEDEKLIAEMVQSHEETEIVEETEEDEEEIDDYYANVLPDIEATLKKNTKSNILMAICMITSALMIVYVCLSVL